MAIYLSSILSDLEAHPAYSLSSKIDILAVMDNCTYQIIAGSSAYLSSREFTGAYFIGNPHLFKDVVTVALDFNDKNHYKAFLILDFILERNITWLKPFLDSFCEQLPQIRHESASRTGARICMMAVNHHLKTKDFLSDTHSQQIAEKSFDWLIDDSKVAVKAHAMRSLYGIGTLQPWIHPELTEIIKIHFANQSPGYKATAKHILKAVQKFNNRC